MSVIACFEQLGGAISRPLYSDKCRWRCARGQKPKWIPRTIRGASLFTSWRWLESS